MWCYKGKTMYVRMISIYCSIMQNTQNVCSFMHRFFIFFLRPTTHESMSIISTMIDGREGRKEQSLCVFDLKVKTYGMAGKIDAGIIFHTHAMLLKNNEMRSCVVRSTDNSVTIGWKHWQNWVVLVKYLNGGPTAFISVGCLL